MSQYFKLYLTGRRQLLKRSKSSQVLELVMPEPLIYGTPEATQHRVMRLKIERVTYRLSQQKAGLL